VPKILLYAASIVVFLHGLIHLMGVAVYLKITEIKGLDYKTKLLGGRWDVGDTGIRLFGALWLIPTIGFAIAAYGLVAGLDWWRPTLLATTLFSLVITGLDWTVAYMGTIINVVILAVLLLGPLFV
jgi:hypothetical protein